MQKVILAFVVFFIVLTLVVGFVFYVPEDSIGEEVRFEVSRGTSLMQLSHELVDSAIITNPHSFYYTFRMRESGHPLKAGLYLLNRNGGILRTIDKLKQAPLVEEFAFMVPEGLMISDVASRAAAFSNAIDSAYFVKLCNESSFIARCNISNVSSLEGYLFPETYSFSKNVTAEDIILRMTNTYKSVFAQLSMSPRVSRYTPYQLLSLASIVEMESKVAHERPIIAGVFYNRLERGIPLGADATVRYAVKRFTGPLRKSELNVNSPYNTRRFRGIPPSPICSPGRSALEATLNPAKTDALFFVAKWDGSGEHLFSRTNAEHERRKMEIRRANKELSNW